MQALLQPQEAGRLYSCLLEESFGVRNFHARSLTTVRLPRCGEPHTSPVERLHGEGETLALQFKLDQPRGQACRRRGCERL